MVGELTHERICRAYPGYMGRRVRGAVRAFPLGCGPVCLLQRRLWVLESGLPTPPGVVLGSRGVYQVHS